MQEKNYNIFSFGFDENGKANLKTISQWATVYAIVSFIGIGFVVFALVTVVVKYSSNALNSFTLLTSFITIAIRLILNILLYSASSQIRKALNELDNSSLSAGLSSLKSYFKLLGILLILLLVFVIFIALRLMFARSGVF